MVTLGSSSNTSMAEKVKFCLNSRLPIRAILISGGGGCIGGGGGGGGICIIRVGGNDGGGGGRRFVLDGRRESVGCGTTGFIFGDTYSEGSSVVVCETSSPFAVSKKELLPSAKLTKLTSSESSRPGFIVTLLDSRVEEFVASRVIAFDDSPDAGDLKISRQL
jgi:hypothetical protein